MSPYEEQIVRELRELIRRIVLLEARISMIDNPSPYGAGLGPSTTNAPLQSLLNYP